MKRNFVAILAVVVAFGLGFAMRSPGKLSKLVSFQQGQPSDSSGKKHVNSLTFDNLAVTAKVDLSDVTFSFQGVPSHSASFGVQLYLHRAAEDDWQQISATSEPDGGDKTVFSVYRHIPANIEFTAQLKPGKYDNYRLILFPAADGKSIDFGHTVYDTAKETGHKDALSFDVTSTAQRVSSPQLIIAPVPSVVADGSGTYTVTIPAKVELPTGYPTDGGGLWVMAKGLAGFSQLWVPFSSAVPDGGTNNRFNSAPVKFELKGVKAGLWNSQFGVFKSTWGDPLQWVYPGLDFEVGGDAWVAKSSSHPPRVSVASGRFVYANAAHAPASLYADDPGALTAVSFVRGGNYGNAVTWTDQPALDTPGFFALLGDTGCRFVRFNYNPDKYLSRPMYQHVVDQVVQNIWQAGEYPLIAPQDLPNGNTLPERIASGNRLAQMVAAKYKGLPVWIEVCNEPHEFGTWAAWKPVAEQYAKTIRAIDPSAFVVVPFENYSKDGRGAAASPITDTHVDLYDGHAYVGAADVQSLFGPATKAGLPVLIGEFGGTDPVYLKSVALALQSLRPSPVAIAPWAFTIKGQDALPLVDSSTGASITYTPAGQVIADAYGSWLGGKRAQ